MMPRFADLLTNLAATLPLPTLFSVLGGLVGVAFAADNPGTFPVETPAGTVALGDLSLPVALVVFGTTLGRAVAALKEWRPHVIVEHRHTHAAPVSPAAPPRLSPAPAPGEDTP